MILPSLTERYAKNLMPLARIVPISGFFIHFYVPTALFEGTFLDSKCRVFPLVKVANTAPASQRYGGSGVVETPNIVTRR